MLEFQFKHVRRVLLSEEVVAFLEVYDQRGGQPETGGVLAGQFLSDESLLVTHAMPPSLKNKAGRTWLLRDRRAAQEWINKMFQDSKGEVNYVGEWHTHPARKLCPSGPDKQMINDLLETSHLSIDFLIGVIVGTDKGHLGTGY